MSGFEVPTRIGEEWLEKNCGKLTITQARELVEALRARGWRHGVEGSLDDRVIGRLKPSVRARIVEDIAAE